MRLLLALGIVATLSAGCDVTELVVQVESDLAVPAELDEVVVEVVGPDCEARTSRGSLSGDGAVSLPVTLSLRHEGGPLGPVIVTAIGRAAGAEVVRQTVETEFVSGEQNTLSLSLDGSCVGMSCAAGSTCRTGNCVALSGAACTAPVDAASPDAASPDAARPDAGGDGGRCDDCDYTPSNTGDRIPFDDTLADVVVGGSAFDLWVIDTDEGSIVAYDDPDIATASSMSIRAAGEGDIDGIVFRSVSSTGPKPSLGVFSVRSLEVSEGARVVGRGERPLVIIVATVAQIEGTITVGADRLIGVTYAGPGGFAGAVLPREAGDGPGGGGPALTDTGVSGGAGGAGGSFGTAGGTGGPANMMAGNTVGAPASSYGDPTLVPLVGGSGGGPGGNDVGRGVPGLGGNGGGALQLSARDSIFIEVTGRVGASGGGGFLTGGAGGGGGGGSGGAILLEANTIEIRGAVGANGGSGSTGKRCMGDDGDPGVRGEPDTVPAPGSPGAVGECAGGAGDGSDAEGLTGDGIQSTYGGGGGGGAGRIRINSATGATFDRGVLPTVGSGLAAVGTPNR